MNLLDIRTRIGLDLKMGKNQPAGMFSFFLVDLCLTSQNNKQLLPFLQLRQITLLQQKLEKKLCGLRVFLAALGYRLPGHPVSLRVDNRQAILLTANPEFHRRTKHIELQYHWIRENVKSKEITITYISIKEIVADGLTKALDPEAFKAFWAMIGMD